MEKINQNYLGELENKVLSVFCYDSIDIRARVTFDSCLVEDVQITYWMDDAPDAKERINNMFDFLFEEVIKNRQINQGVVEKS